MSQWKCIICGTTILSKCPGHRSEFYGPEVSMIQSVVTVDRIDYHGSRLSGLSELMLTYTAPANKTTAEQVRILAEMLTKNGIIEAMTCNHYFVMNSETERKCCLDHEHSNLTDVERLLAKHKAAQLELTLSDTTKALAKAACTPIHMARKAINCSKPTYDSFVEQEFEHLKNMVHHAVEQLTIGKTFRKPYRVLTNGPRVYSCDKGWLYADGSTEATYVYFDRPEDAIAMSRGYSRRLDIEELSLTDDHGYRSVEYDMSTNCVHCGKLNDPEKEIVVRLLDGEAHLTCVNRKKNDDKEKVRRGRFVLEGPYEPEYYHLRGLKRWFSLDELNFWWNEGRNRTEVYLQMTASKSGLEDTIAALKKKIIDDNSSTTNRAVPTEAATEAAPYKKTKR